ncbi:MBL fold metallo-hydrolase [Metarhizobium album]|uniref:MBL fold metallo-hydrolase n=1 Tax=Metarhizobium album TaxID=2182425 RepID=A0A2U2DJG3_9HYPH|nr:MBL fold metallo-hydrolase [Rhizobium album]PWE53444.1 MBL fold metallo-hydrolase [Rhizobium album]
MGTVALAASSEVAAAQELDTPLLPPKKPLPTVDARFPVEVAPGVFVLLDKRIPLVPNIGIVVGRETVLVIDCGLGIDSAESVLALAKKLAPGRQVALTVTHAHPEHGFGAQVFKSDARIYYNSLQRDYFAQSGQKLLDGFRAGVLPAEQKHLLDNVVLTPPHQVYDQQRVKVDLGGREVELRTWGKAHTPGDQIAFLPAERIVFMGDLAEERMFPIVPLFPPMITAEDMNIAQWEVALNDVLRLQPSLVVPGHGSLGGPETISEVLGYFQEVRRLVQSANLPERRLLEVIRAKYPTWENPEFIEPATVYFSQET